MYIELYIITTKIINFKGGLFSEVTITSANKYTTGGFPNPY